MPDKLALDKTDGDDRIAGCSARLSLCSSSCVLSGYMFVHKLSDENVGDDICRHLFLYVTKAAMTDQLPSRDWNVCMYVCLCRKLPP